MSRLRLLSLAVFLLMVCTISLVVMPRHSQAPPQGGDPGAAGSEGLRVAFDSETGDMIPATGNPRAKGPLGLDRSHEGLTQVVRPDGSATVDLQGRFQCYATVGMDAQGRVHVDYEHGQATSQTEIEE